MDFFMKQPTMEDGFVLPMILTRNLCLYGRDFEDWVLALKPFFSKYGPNMKYLEISHGIGNVTEEFFLKIAEHVEALEELSISGAPGALSSSWADDWGFQFYPKLPSVRILNVALDQTCFKRWIDVKTFFTDFFSSFPNLKVVKFTGQQFTELFKYLPKEVKFDQVESVHLNVFTSEGLLDFISRRLNLTKLVLDVETLLGLNNLHMLIESFAKSLRHLEVRFSYEGSYNYAHNATAFPSSRALVQLEILQLYGYWGDLYFLNDFPKLRTACVEKMAWNIAFPHGPQVLSQAKRRVLKFYDENGIFTSV
jgi:hypothetical protein